MKVTKVDIMLLNPDDPFWRPVVCRVYTDEGIYGDGEAAVAYVSGAPGAFGYMQDLAKILIGMDPLDNEVFWDNCHKDTFWMQNGGPITFSALSALDIALWDIKGKFFNVPVYKLIGGKKRDKLRTYASQLQFGWDDTKLAMGHTEDYVAKSLKAVSEGYDCIKIDFLFFDRDGLRINNKLHTVGLMKPYYTRLFEERLAAVREGVGPDVDIIVENHSNLDTNAALQVGKISEKYNVFYFEEPNTPFAKTSKALNDKLSVPLSHGERLFSRWQYLPFFEDQSLRVIQPDLGNCGGITEGKKICDMAIPYDVAVQLHLCASPISTAAALQVEAVIPNFIIHEHHVFSLYEYNRKLAKFDLQPENGMFEIPDRPGIGNELSDFALNNCLKVTIQQPQCHLNLGKEERKCLISQ